MHCSACVLTTPNYKLPDRTYWANSAGTGFFAVFTITIFGSNINLDEIFRISMSYKGVLTWGIDGKYIVYGKQFVAQYTLCTILA